MDDPSELQDEIISKNTEIARLRSEIWETRDRVAKAEDRHLQIQQQVSRLSLEITIRRAKANELEDKAAVHDIDCGNVDRKLATDNAAAASEAADIKRKMCDFVHTRNHALQQAVVETEKIKQVKDLVTDAAQLLTVVQDEVVQQRKELVREEVSQGARQAQAAVSIKMSSPQLASAEQAWATSCSEECLLEEQCRQLEHALQLEKAASTELVNTTAHTEKQSELMARAYDSFQQELDTLDSESATAALESELTASQRQHEAINLQLVGVQHASLRRIQALQGAADETHRMMSDHLDQTQMGIAGSSVPVLLQALSKARSDAAAMTLKYHELEINSEVAHRETGEAEAALAAAFKAAEQRLLMSYSQGLDNKMQEHQKILELLSHANRRLLEQETALQEVESAYADTELVLRSKLEELWDAIP